MGQTSDKSSRETYVETRDGLRFFHTEEQQTEKGWYWCYEKQGFFRYSDWHLTEEEMEKKYGKCY